MAWDDDVDRLARDELTRLAVRARKRQLLDRESSREGFWHAVWEIVSSPLPWEADS